MEADASSVRAARSMSINSNKDIAVVAQGTQALVHNIGKRLFGLDKAIHEIVIALLAEGHILLEDVPGVGKTALAKSFAQHLDLTFERIQCTPDMLPGDILGGLIFNPKTTEFQLRTGPIFTNILLVDEINRALPRTQSALLEAMAEGQVTIDGQTHVLPKPFMVIATQNPLESQGVFPLPEAQLDRFLMKTTLGYPDETLDVLVLRAHLQTRAQSPADEAPSGLATHAHLVSANENEVLDSREAIGAGLLKHANAAVDAISVTDEMLAYISKIVHATREHSDVQIGASPRAMIMMAKAARAAAVIDGRNFVTPDDVQRVAPLVLPHRLIMHSAGIWNSDDASRWITDLIKSVPVPLEEVAP